MSLLGLGIAAAGLYGLSMAWTEMSAESARKRLQRIENEEGHVDVVEHFDLILAMLDIKKYNGVIPEDGYKECQDLLMYELMNVTRRDLEKIKQQYIKVRKEQIKAEERRRKEYSKDAKEFIRKYMIPGRETQRYDRINSYEELEDTIRRCNELYQNTPWKRLAKRPAKIIETPDGKVKEMWLIRRFIHPRHAYKKCNKVIGHEVY